MIRPADPQDAAGIAGIWNEIIRTTTITFTTAEKSAADIAQLISQQVFLVLEQEGRVTGFATFGPFRSGPGYADTAEHTIYLEPGAQGQGKGRALLQHLQEAARRSGVRHLVGGISGTNTGAVAFHEEMGFKLVGHLPEIGQKFGTRHDLVLMQKSLSPGAEVAATLLVQKDKL